MSDKIKADRATAMRLLYSVLIASALLPVLLIGYAVWADKQATYAAADDRISKSLAVLHEHALKVFQSVELALQNIDDVIAGLSDEEIAAREKDLHARLVRLQRTLQVQSVWALGRDGRPLVTSTRYPAPREMSFRDRDYFAALEEADQGSMVTNVLRPRLTDHALFSVARRRSSGDGSFTGVVGAALLPKDFRAFYGEIAGTPGAYYAMIREDGTFLVRYPEAAGNQAPLAAPFLAIVKAGSGIGVFPSRVDDRNRRLGWRRIENHPIYVLAGQEIAAIDAEWRSRMWWNLGFGLPLEMLVLALIGLTIRRTQRLYDEAERRDLAESALRQSQRMEAIGQLTGGVAHDFNNLLMVMQGAVERLRRQQPPPEERPLQMIATAVQRAVRLTNHLLAFSRQKAHVKETADLCKYLAGLEEVLQRSLRGDIQISLTVAREPCVVAIDLAELELAILNVAVNARDAMPQGGTLSIDVRLRLLTGGDNNDGLTGKFVAIRIADTGTGIPSEVLPRVFEPFFTTKEVGKGTGLGLSQVYGFASQSGGTITIETEPGRGTAVTIYLPRSMEGPVARPRAQSDLSAPPERNMTVLVVEDNAEVAEVCRSYLEQLGYRASVVDNASRGLAAVRGGEPIDLVLTDVVMAGELNGIGLARILRQEFPRLPVVLTTGYSTDIGAAADEFPMIRKPYNMAELRKLLEQVLGR